MNELGVDVPILRILGGATVGDLVGDMMGKMGTAHAMRQSKGRKKVLVLLRIQSRMKWQKTCLRVRILKVVES